MGSSFAVLFAFLAFPFSTAYADVTISSDATQNMTCSNGMCAPTAPDAVLNVSDLENLLASGNLTVTTTGSGGVQADNLDVTSAFGWSSTSTLSLDAFETVAVDSAVSITGQSGLSLTTNDGGSGGVFAISRKGSITFQDLSSSLAINGISYTLIDSISTLASAIASNPGGTYAFANSYDASGDGTYTASPIQTAFTGAFEGLGNSISNLSIDNETSGSSLGLFSLVFVGTVEHLNLTKVSVVGAHSGGDCIGTVAGISNGGYLFQDTAMGTIRERGRHAGAGGLACFSGGSAVGIDRSFSGVQVEASKARASYAGGLVGDNEGGIRESFSTGSVIVGDSSIAGGLVGVNSKSTIQDSYATGSIAGGSDSKIGGFIGKQEQQSYAEVVETSYATSAVSGGTSGEVGGFVGLSASTAAYGDDYWDMTTSGTSQAVGKGKSRGITGLTTEQLQSGLPNGFDPAIWGEKSKINNGLPYLLANPPPT